MVRWANVDVVGVELGIHLGGDGLGLADLLRLQPVTVEHVLEVHVAADVQLVGVVECGATVLEEAGQDPVDDCCANLGLDVVTDDRHASGTELLGPLRVRRDEHRDGVDEGHTSVDARLGVEALGVFRAHGEVGHEHVGAAVAQHLGHVAGLGRGFFNGGPVVLVEAVEGRAAVHSYPNFRDVGEADRVVLPSPDGLGEVGANLGGVDVERGNRHDVTDVVASELHVHESRNAGVASGVLVVVDALEEGVRTVADTGDCEADSCHGW